MPRLEVTTGKRLGEVLQVMGVPCTSELGCDVEGERVAADIGEVLTEQVSSSGRVPDGGGAHDFDVMTFPDQQWAAGVVADGCGEGIEVGDGELEDRVGFDRLAQGAGHATGVAGSLCLAIPRGRPLICGDDASVVFYGGVVRGRVIGGVRGLHTVRVLLRADLALTSS
jgi:hypothetical protein